MYKPDCLSVEDRPHESRIHRRA